jgi:hypothetical protein
MFIDLPDPFAPSFEYPLPGLHILKQKPQRRRVDTARIVQECHGFPRSGVPQIDVD